MALYDPTHVMASVSGYTFSIETETRRSHPVYWRIEKLLDWFSEFKIRSKLVRMECRPIQRRNFNNLWKQHNYLLPALYSCSSILQTLDLCTCMYIGLCMHVENKLIIYNSHTTEQWHTYIHTCIHIYIHIYIHTYMHTYMHIYMHTLDLWRSIYVHVYI